MRTLSVSLFFAGVTTLLAQFDTGQIAGFVRDASQSVITGATVTIRNENTGEQRQVTSNTTGYYVFPALVVGT